MSITPSRSVSEESETNLGREDGGTVGGGGGGGGGRKEGDNFC